MKGFKQTAVSISCNQSTSYVEKSLTMPLSRPTANLCRCPRSRCHGPAARGLRATEGSAEHCARPRISTAALVYCAHREHSRPRIYSAASGLRWSSAPGPGPRAVIRSRIGCLTTRTQGSAPDGTPGAARPARGRAARCEATDTVGGLVTRLRRRQARASRSVRVGVGLPRSADVRICRLYSATCGNRDAPAGQLDSEAGTG